MTGGGVKKSSGVVRPIKTKKDYAGAASVVKEIVGLPDRKTVAE
jgi:hypothetical protein